MMSNLKVEVKDLRFSFIWTQVFTELFEDPNPWVEILTEIFKGASNASVSAESQQILELKSISDTYKLILEKIISGEVNILQLPWHLKVDNPKYFQNFWRFYLMEEGERDPIGLKDISIDRVWKQLVPFRSKVSLPYKVTASWLQNGRVSIESFYYPFGLGLVISVSCNQIDNQLLSSDDVISTAIKVRTTEKFSVQWKDKASTLETLEELANSCFKAIQENGQLLSISKPLAPPFTIATIVQGITDQQDSDDLNNSEVHRMLEGLTLWKCLRPFEHPTDLSKCKIEFERECFPRCSENHWLYHHDRSRAVFFPDAFSDNSLPRIHKLGCYHRNLVMTSLQVESLGCLVREVDKVVQEGKSLNTTYEFFARRATGILSRLYGCHTYRSPSIRIQIDKNGLVDPINRARDRWIKKEKNDKGKDHLLHRGRC